MQEVAEHSTKKDLYLIINDKVYDCTTFANEHPYVVSISITAESRIPIPEAKEQALARVEEKSEKKKKGHLNLLSSLVSHCFTDPHQTPEPPG